MKKVLSLITILMFITITLSACAVPNMGETGDSSDQKITDKEQDETDVKKETFTICTEKVMEDEIASIVEYYQKSNDSNLAIEILALSNDIDEKNMQISQIQTEIMSGIGPDLFVLYSNDPRTEYAASSGGNALFKNLDKAIYNNIFYDLTSLIENDDNFTLEDYNETVIKAGQTDDGFFAFPLYYSFLAMSADSECKIPDFEINISTIENIDNKYIQSRLAAYSKLYFSSIVPNMIDYKNEEILLSQEEFSQYIQNIKDLKQYELDYSKMTEEEIFENDMKYFSNGYFDTVIFDYYKKDDTIIPLYNVDGNITASVITYSAINRNTKFPEEAFGIIKTLLDENIQAGKGVFFEDKAYGYNRFTSNFVLPVNNNSVTEMVKYNVITECQESLNSQLLDCISKIEDAHFLNDIDYVLFNELVWNERVDSEKMYSQINTLIHE